MVLSDSPRFPWFTAPAEAKGYLANITHIEQLNWTELKARTCDTMRPSPSFPPPQKPQNTSTKKKGSWLKKNLYINIFEPGPSAFLLKYSVCGGGGGSLTLLFFISFLYKFILFFFEVWVFRGWWVAADQRDSLCQEGKASQDDFPGNSFRG